jgi:hypothetical protein
MESPKDGIKGSDDEHTNLIAKLEKDLKRAHKNDKLKTDLLNKLTKAVKAKDEQLAQLEAKSSPNDEDERQAAEGSEDATQWKEKAERLEADIKILQDKLSKEAAARAAAEHWKEMADAMSNDVKTLQEKMQKELETKEEAEEWKAKHDALFVEATELKERLEQESRKRLDTVEMLSQQQLAHKESLSKHQAMYNSSVQEFDERTDELAKEMLSLKEANLVLQARVDKSRQEIDELCASKTALQGLDQDQKAQILKIQAEVSFLQSAKAELRRQWASATAKNQSFQKFIQDEQDRTLSEMTYWKDMNERLYDSFSNSEKLLQEAREEADTLKSMEDTWKMQIQDLTMQLSSQRAESAKEHFNLKDQVQSLLRRNALLVEEQAQQMITREEFREQAEQSTERIKQLEYKVDTLTTQLTALRGVESKRNELQVNFDDLHARYDHLASRYKESLVGMSEERAQFKEVFECLMEDHRDMTSNFVKARNLINNNAALFVASEMSRQAQALLDQTAKVQDKLTIPPDLFIETPPDLLVELEAIREMEASRDDDGHATEEEKKQEDQETVKMSLTEIDSMVSYESTKGGTVGEDDETYSSHGTTITDMNRAELWFWGLLDGSTDRKDLSPAMKGKRERPQGSDSRTEK